MKCIICGQEVNDDAFMCSYCGTPVKTSNSTVQESELLAPPAPTSTPVQVNNVNNAPIVETNNVPVQPVQPGAMTMNSVPNANVQSTPQAVTHTVNHNVNGTLSPIAQELEKEEEVKYVKTGLLSAFGIVNIILYVGSMIGLYCLAKEKTTANLKTILLGVTFIYFYLICSQKILIKAGIPWWHMFIPILNIYAFYKVSFSESVAKTIMFFTIVVSSVIGYLIFQNTISSLNLAIQISKVAFGIIMPIIDIFQLVLLGRNFGMSGFLTLLFPPIMIPIIAFSSCEYQG